MNEAAGPSFLPFMMLLVFFLFIYFVTIISLSPKLFTGNVSK